MQIADAQIGEIIKVKLPGLRGDLVNRYLVRIPDGFLDVDNFVKMWNLDSFTPCEPWGRIACISDELGVRYYAGPKGVRSAGGWVDYHSLKDALPK
jgi:hypothetical protein